MKKIILVIIAIVVLVLSLITCGSCSSSSYDDACTDLSSEDITTNDKIVEFHQAHFTKSNSKESKDKNIVCIDFSDGITNYSLKDENNQEIYKAFLKVFTSDAENTDFYELSNDSLIKKEFNYKYFEGEGFKNADGKFKIAAPIKKAIDLIANGDNLGVLITDGELFQDKDFNESAWSSGAIKKWLKKGNRIEVIYTDFNEGDYKKHMYIMCFVPQGGSQIMNNYYTRLTDINAKYDTLIFNTNISALWQRKYKDSQHPGTDFIFNDFVQDPEFNPGEVNGIQLDMEYINLTDVDFSAPESQEEFSLIYNMRDLNKKALIQKLYFDFGKIENYIVKPENIKLVVHDVYDDYNSFKLNKLARSVNPECTDSLDENNKMYCHCSPSIDGEEVYDINGKDLKDTVNRYEPILVDKFKYNQTPYDIYNGNVKDVFELDLDAGKNNELNDKGLFEIVIKFSPKLTSANKYLKGDRNNLLRVDVVLDNPEVKPLKESALVWNRINDGSEDRTLYDSFNEALKEEDVIPGGVLYSYYIEFGPYVPAE